MVGATASYGQDCPDRLCLHRVRGREPALGRLPDCGTWNTLVEEVLERSAPARASGPVPAPVPITEVAAQTGAHRPTGVEELDRVLGSGLVPGSVVLLAGEPGIDLDPAAGGAGRPRRRGPGAVRLRRGVARAGPPPGRAPGGPAPGAAAGRRDRPGGRPVLVEQVGPAVVVVDSVQTVADPELAGAPGGVGQVREVAAQLVRLAKGVPSPPSWSARSPRTAPWPAPRRSSTWSTWSSTSRATSTTPCAWSAAQEPFRARLRGRLLRDDRGRPGAGGRPVAAVPVRPHGRGARGRMRGLEGRRPLVTEVQALVVPTGVAVPSAPPRGWTPGRLAILVAVLDRRARIGLAGNDVFAATAGGGITEPAADLAICLALASAARDRQVPAELVTFGEVGLGGEVRPGANCRAGSPRRPGWASAAPSSPPPACPTGPGPPGSSWTRSGRWPSRCPSWPASRPPPPPAGGGAPDEPGAPMSMDDRLLEVLRQVAPGTPLRPGLEADPQGQHRGADRARLAPQVEALFTGGFQIDVPFTAQRLSELAKMDGAMVLDETASRILWANVHLMPDPAIPTVETGTRHHTAERVARQAAVPVISVSTPCAPSPCTSRTGATCSRTSARCCRGPTRRSPPWTTTGPASTRTRAALDAHELHGQPPSGTS